jgi:threonine/homoserine/homoserine lactone efflux protein
VTVTAAFLAGAVAGYAIAVPVGVIAVLLLETGMRRGFRSAAAAAAGAATADGIYATLAAAFGTALAGVVSPVTRPVRLIAVVALAVIGTRGILSARRGTTGGRSQGLPASLRGTYGRLLALTLLNPATVVYFAALILGLPSIGTQPPERAAFVAGVFLSSLSWQMLLAAVGALAHRRLPPRVQVAASIGGNLVVLAFAVAIAYGLVRG